MTTLLIASSRMWRIQNRLCTEVQDYEKDFAVIISCIFYIMDNLDTIWWEQDKATMLIYKQMLFPRGIQLSPDKKVYIPEISAIYRYGSNKKAPEEAGFTRVEGPVGLEPTTPCLKGRCSNRLSYGPKKPRSWLLVGASKASLVESI